MSSPPAISLISLGCPKTVVDSEKILGQIAESGGVICEDIEDSDIVVVNTCSFIEEAISESLDVVHEMVERKNAGACKAIIVAGCLAQRFGKELREEIPEVDVWVGVDEEHQIAGICRAVAEDAMEHCAQLQIERTKSPLPSQAGRLRITSRHTAYLKISEGCDNVCSFCVIPKIRGRLRSKPQEVLLEEARELAADGAVELVLVAQDSTDYGRDLYGRRALAELMHELGKIDGVRWNRLLYAFPAHFSDEMVQALAECDHFCKYLDIPLQHISDPMLQRMRREVGREQTEKLLLNLRKVIPGLVLRTSIIVGFPGETEEQFQELLDFLERVRFDRLGAFRYSHEEGTAAFRYQDQVPEEVKEDRLNRLMSAQQRIAFEYAQAQVGRQVEILIDRQSTENRELYEGRSYAEAPEIDGLIRIQGRNLKTGGFYPCEIISADGYDLVGFPVERHLQTASAALRVLSESPESSASSLFPPRRL